MDAGAFAVTDTVSSLHIGRVEGGEPASQRALADLAVGALVQEALLTPKPALVDTRGSGAHTDLDLLKMLRSARALRGCFQAIAAAAWGETPSWRLRERLAEVGRAGERVMLEATGGANAHRGAIWCLGLLVGAAAGSRGISAPPGALFAWAAALVSYPDRGAPPARSNGALACARHGVSGARGEAAAGFPHVAERGLPALLAGRRSGRSEQSARIDALLTIMSSLDDTCLLHRGGLVALQAAQAGARAVLRAGGAATRLGRGALLRLDRELTSLNASPGGSADLLAATLFTDALRARRAQRSHCGRVIRGDL